MDIRAAGCESDSNSDRTQTFNGQQVRFLDRDPVPLPLRGREGRLEQLVGRQAIVLINGARHRVPKDWLVTPFPPKQGTPHVAETEPSPTYRQTDNDLITRQEWDALLSACRKARLHPIQRKRLIADTLGIPICDVGIVPITRAQYRRAVARLEEYRSRKSNRLDPECVNAANTTDPDPQAQVTDSNGRGEGSLEQFWDAFYKDCRELGLEQWQARQVIADAIGVSPDDLDVSRLGRQHLLQAYERLEELEKKQIRVPLSPPPTETRQSTLPWDAPELPHKFRLEGSRIPWAEPFRGGIPPWRWDGYWCEEDREDK